MRQISWKMRAMTWLAVVPTALLPLVSGPAEAQQRKEYLKATERHPKSELPAGRTDKLTAAQWKQVHQRREREELANRPDVRPLSALERLRYAGRGPYRNKYFAGTLPWHRSIRDINLCNGNLFKSFTDIQVSPAKGAGLAMQRTYNSMDDRIGPFGQGWTHAYDIRTVEENPDTNYTDDSLNYMDRTDFFGGRHKYHRDADGLYSPPAYLFDETDSNYDKFLVNGPVKSLEDTERGMDGTVKHFVTNQNSLERVCDYIEDRYGNRTNLAYTQTTVGGLTVNLLQSVTDPSGRQILYTWSNLGSNDQPAWRITVAQGPAYSVAYAYNQDLNLSSVTLDPGDTAQGHANRTTTFGYTTDGGAQGTEAGLLSSVTDALNHTVSYTYLDPANVQMGTAWCSTATEPSSGGNYVWTVGSASTTSGGSTWAIGGSSSTGLMYFGGLDSQLRVWLSGTQNSGQTYRQSYDSANNVTQLKSGGAGFSAFYPWPGPTTGGSSGDNSVNATNSVSLTYGPHGNVLTQSVDGYSGETTTTTYYNASQYFQKASVTDANGHTSTFIIGTNQGVDPTGQLATSNGNKGSVLYVRDAGYGVSTSPSYQKQFAYQYNDFGQKVQETNLNNVVAQYIYGDQWGNLTQVVQDPHVTQGDSHLARTTQMVYDGAGRVSQSTDPRGLTCFFAYSSLGQPTSAAVPANGSAPAETITYSYGANGRPETVSDNRGTTTLAYENGNDRLASVTDPVTGTISYTYGLSGERRTMTLPGGGTWTYAYYGDTLGALRGIEGKDDPNVIAPMLATITDDQGRQVEYHLDLLGGLHEVVCNQVFNANLQLVGYQDTHYVFDLAQDGTLGSHRRILTLANTYHWKSGQGQQQQWQSRNLVQNDYTFDLTGQRLTNTISSSGGTNRTEQYGYDELNRLKTVDFGDGQNQSYAFDAMGNRSSKVDSVNGTEGYSYNAANMLLSRAGNAYTNDAAGNTLTGGGLTNTWDSQNRLVQCVHGTDNCSFVYGPDGLRRQSTVNSTVTDYVLDNSMSVRERRAGANLATYLVGCRGPEYRRDDVAGSVRWYLYDSLGSVLGEVDSSGTVTSSRKYDVYGLVRGGSNSAGSSRHKFVGSLGHPSEDETGLIYMRARYYDPAVGRFISEDPSANGRNWYAYCNNNPINQYDVTGRIPAWLVGMIEAAEAQFYDTVISAVAAHYNITLDPSLSPGEQAVALRKAIIERIKHLGRSTAEDAVEMKKSQQGELVTDGVDAADEASKGVSMIEEAKDLSSGISALSVLDMIQGLDGEGI